MKLLRGVLAAALASAAAVGSVLSASAYELERHTQSEIKDMYEKLYFDTHSVPEFTQNYSTEYPANAGKLSEDTLEEGLNSINFCRYLAGLPYDVELDEEYNTAAQNASLIIYMNADKALTHKPEQPENMGDDLYASAYKASGECNIGKGYLNTQASVVQGYMSDTDTSNLPMLGHRRWILNPDMQKTGIGSVGNGTAMYVRDKSREDKFTGDYLCWPPAAMPNEMVGNGKAGYAYSVTLNNAYDKPERDKVKVKLTSKLLGKTIVFDKNSSNSFSSDEELVGYFDISESYIGFGNCIIFNPGVLPANDVVDVEITGIYKNGVESPITYKVNYFDLLDESDYPLGFDQKNYELELGSSMMLSGYKNPLTNSVYRLYYGTDPGTKITDYVDKIESGGSVFMTGKKEGVFTVYLGDSSTYYSDYVTTVTVTHRHVRGGWIIDEVAREETPGSRHRECTLCGKIVDEEVLPATSLTVADVQFYADKFIYTGEAVEPKIKVYSGEKRLVQGTDYVVEYENNTDTGTGVVIIKGKGYFEGEKRVEFEIVKRDPVSVNKLDISFKSDNIYYTGKDIEPKVTVKEGANTLVKDKDYTLTYENNHNAGTAKIVIKGQGDYVGTRNMSFTIQPADIGYPWENGKLGDVKYTGLPIMLRLKLKSQVSGEELTEGVDYEVSYKDNTNVGTATITVTGIGNYSGTTTNTFAIVEAADYTGPDERDDLIEMDCNTALVIKGASEEDTDITFIGEDGTRYKVVAVIDCTFYADLPEGEYVVWILRRSCRPVCTNITAGSVLASVDVGVYKYGDLNRDGDINVTDIAISAAITKGIRPPVDDEQGELADVNLDGEMNVTDTLIIAAHAKSIRALVVDVDFEIPDDTDSRPGDEGQQDDLTTDEQAEIQYEKIKADYLEEFGTEWGERSLGYPGFANLDLDGDEVDELFIQGSYIYGTPDRLYAIVDGKAELLKEVPQAEGKFLVLTDKDGEVYVQWTESGSTYFEVYKYAGGKLELQEKLVFSPAAPADKDFGEYTRIDLARLTELNEGQIVFD
ncbi:dockerin type I domain-containing protein [Ruminococcus sp.]|uniref:dockerin type I domain-containing protein n=1 Tax=Ruminococcus sp. TaxID=41978 RepID=UPI0025CD1A2D|nr:dockerin type I domain-containing protein [Ruminococcus sp.]